MLSWNRNRPVLDRILRYMALARETLQLFSQGLEHYRHHGLDAHFEQLMLQTDARESSADQLRREVELELFRKSLLPESREDILLLMERVDLIPNQAEEALRMLLLQRPPLSEEVTEALLELTTTVLEAFDLIVEGVEKVLNGGDSVTEVSTRVFEKEKVCDVLEHRAVGRIFEKDAVTAEKLLCRDAVLSVGALADLEEDVAYLLMVFAAKRQV